MIKVHAHAQCHALRPEHLRGHVTFPYMYIVELIFLHVAVFFSYLLVFYWLQYEFIHFLIVLMPATQCGCALLPYIGPVRQTFSFGPKMNLKWRRSMPAGYWSTSFEILHSGVFPDLGKCILHFAAKLGSPRTPDRYRTGAPGHGYLLPNFAYYVIRVTQIRKFPQSQKDSPAL